jgi:hypothetical protein
LLDPEVNFGQFLHGAQIMWARHEKVGGQDLGDHRAHERQRRQVGAPSLAFALEPGVREGGENDVALPPGKGASLEMIETEFVLQLLILLLDRPALVRELRASGS